MKTGKMPSNVGNADTAPDYDFWVAMPSWTREEAIALLAGRDPARPHNAQTINEDTKKIELLIDRAFSFGVFPNAIQNSPRDYLSTIASSNVPIPPDLLSAMKRKKIDLRNWKLECEQLSAENKRLAKLVSEQANSASPPNENVTGLKRKIGSLQTMVLGIAIDKFNLKKNWQNSSVAGNISSAITRAGLSLSEDTIRKHLDETVAAKGAEAKFKT
ncbi:MAG: hypothetical protein KDD85_11450 [Parvularculaceae bacterium]|nr:hypothetical protein [Parvularculaceae bacterium]